MNMAKERAGAAYNSAWTHVYLQRSSSCYFRLAQPACGHRWGGARGAHFAESPNRVRAFRRDSTNLCMPVSCIRLAIA